MALNTLSLDDDTLEDVVMLDDIITLDDTLVDVDWFTGAIIYYIHTP